MLRWIGRKRRADDEPFTDWAVLQRWAKKITADPGADLRSPYATARKRHPPHEVNLAFTYLTVRWFGDLRFEHDVFVEGAPLGPLEALQVYSTDFSTFDVIPPNTIRSLGPKAHAPFHCQHSDGISQFDELTTFGEFIERYKAWTRWSEGDSHSARRDLCGFCGGATIRLFTDEQIDHYRKAKKEFLARREAETEAGVTRLKPRTR